MNDYCGREKVIVGIVGSASPGQVVMSCKYLKKEEREKERKTG